MELIGAVKPPLVKTDDAVAVQARIILVVDGSTALDVGVVLEVNIGMAVLVLLNTVVLDCSDPELLAGSPGTNEISSIVTLVAAYIEMSSSA